MKAYIYINPNAPAEVKDLVAEHFSDVSKVSSVFKQEVTGGFICYETSPPLQNSCHLPISKASEVTLQVLRQKTGNCGSFRPDGTTRRWSLPGEGAGAARGAQGVAARILPP